MATYVLVHGIAHGAWCWEHVRSDLTARSTRARDGSAADEPRRRRGRRRACSTRPASRWSRRHSYEGGDLAPATDRDDVRHLVRRGDPARRRRRVSSMRSASIRRRRSPADVPRGRRVTVDPDAAVTYFYNTCDPAEARAAARGSGRPRWSASRRRPAASRGGRSPRPTCCASGTARCIRICSAGCRRARRGPWSSTSTTRRSGSARGPLLEIRCGPPQAIDEPSGARGERSGDLAPREVAAEHHVAAVHQPGDTGDDLAVVVREPAEHRHQVEHRRPDGEKGIVPEWQTCHRRPAPGRRSRQHLRRGIAPSVAALYPGADAHDPRSRPMLESGGRAPGAWPCAAARRRRPPADQRDRDHDQADGQPDPEPAAHPCRRGSRASTRPADRSPSSRSPPRPSPRPASPLPRRMPAPTTCSPSKSWNTARPAAAEMPVAITASSVVNAHHEARRQREHRRRGSRTRRRPRVLPSLRAPRAADRSRRAPVDAPHLPATPSGTMKLNATAAQSRSGAPRATSDRVPPRGSSPR